MVAVSFRTGGAFMFCCCIMWRDSAYLWLLGGCFCGGTAKCWYSFFWCLCCSWKLWILIVDMLLLLLDWTYIFLVAVLLLLWSDCGGWQGLRHKGIKVSPSKEIISVLDSWTKFTRFGDTVHKGSIGFLLHKLSLFPFICSRIESNCFPLPAIY